jgi:hypothetical protein
VGAVSAGAELPFEIFANGATLPHAAMASIPKIANIEIEMVRLFIIFSPYINRMNQLNTPRIIRLMAMFDFTRRISEPYGYLKVVGSA